MTSQPRETPPAGPGPGPLLTAQDLRVTFATRTGPVPAVRGVSFTLDAGECLAVVGESGSGKSVTARALVGLAGGGSTVAAGRLSYDGTDLTKLRESGWRAIRGRQIGLVLQDALVSLDQLRTVGAEIGEALQTHHIVPRSGVAARTIELLDEVGVPEPHQRARQYPHQLSGGLRQRALIASALAARPRLLIADEPTTALDVTVQAQILTLLERLKQDGVAVLLISHDLGVVARLADRIAVMAEGVFVEQGTAREILHAPQHPYTRMLIEAVPSVRVRRARLADALLSRSDISGPVPPPEDASPGPVLLTASAIGKHFRRPDGRRHDVLQDVSFEVRAGRTLGLVGESGSGKTTAARIALGLTAPDTGRVLFDGAPWSGVPETERRLRRHRIQAVYQDPLSSFDPRHDVGWILGEAAALAGVRRGPARTHRVHELLDLVGLSAALTTRRPREMSGGQRQRVAIARALASSPALLVCDEPVSALDASVQAQILDLLTDLRRDLGLAMLFISHDLGVIRHVSDHVAVLHDGRIVESGPAAEVLDRPHTEYTKALLAAVPTLDLADSSTER